jgi:phosphatidylglycerol:prolipoprotein diacylglycerol transferase
MNWIDPVLLRIGPLQLHWYGFMYALAFLIAYLLFQYSKPGKNLPLKTEQKDNLLIALIFGVLLGGRIGYILFYNLPYFLANPAKIIAVWEGGMSFHGGLLGVGLVIAIYSYKYKLKFLQISDLACFCAPLGIFFGRLGNFINAELYGRISPNDQFCFNFPTDPVNCRYPSQLFEAGLEGLVLFLILFLISRRPNLKIGQITSLFLIFYGIFRFMVEFFREPDLQIGYLLGIFTLGQLFCLAMVLAGFILLFHTGKKAPKMV